MLIPVLPDSAPFSAEQRAYLNGFLAGLFSHAQVPDAGSAPAPSNPPLVPLTILFGSQTGTAEKLAKRAAKAAGARGFAPTLHDLARFPREQLAGTRHVLLVTSTYGDGEPPDNAKAFWEWLRSEAAPGLPETQFAVCALGDSNYPRFCAFGKQLDERLAALGARRALPRVECDVEVEKPFATWLGSALHALSTTSPLEGSGSFTAVLPCSTATEAAEPEEATGWSRERPFPARLKTNRRLSAEGSGKDVRHFEIDLAGSGLEYEVGDALGVRPANDPELVDLLLAQLGFPPEAPVPGPGTSELPVREALLLEYDVARIPLPMLRHFADHTGDATLIRVAAPEANGELTAFLRGRDLLDLLRAHPTVRFAPAEFVGLLRRLQPRLYSISSSLKASPGEVHLTVSAVRYEAHGRKRGGVASTFLADRCPPSNPVPVYVHSNPAFRPPAPDRPLVMIGPGTGIAPFRAFLLERRATGATGKNWLFFGDQRAATDFLYREEIEAFSKEGLLARLDLAWSRDQAEKVYVQHRMLDAAGPLWDWLEGGAALYVCGDAGRMAKDVDAALHQVIERAGSLSAAAARDYVARLQAERRYQRDVY